MSRKIKKLPTPEDLAFYRSKIETGSFIGKNQLAAVFAALDNAEARANCAEERLQSLVGASRAHLEMFEVVAAGVPWGKTCLTGEAITRMNEAPILLRRALCEARGHNG